MKAKKKDPKVITQIKKWLAQEGNSAAKLASALDYTSSTVVNQWIKRGRVPEHQRDRILEFIGAK